MAGFCVFSRKKRKIFLANSPKALTLEAVLSYNKNMQNEMKTKTDKIRIFWRVVTTLACALMLLFIFSNSLKTAEASSAQSSVVVDTIQDVASVIAPQSPIATATGEAYDKLHADVRTLAHFSEFMLLGALFFWCWYSYTDKKIWLLAPAAGAIFTPMIDELLQMLSSGRAAEWFDVAVDVSGGLCGGIFALCTLTLGIHIYRKRKQKIQNAQTASE